jgi:phage baseplate assembly protein W
MAYKFKSSGIQSLKDFVTAQNQQQQTFIPIGLKTPLRLGQTDTEGIYSVNYDLGDQIQDNLRNLIQTNWGERLGLYNYGANLLPLMTDLVNTVNFENEAIQRISNAVSRWMPYVNPKTFVSSIDHINNKNTAVIKLTIGYDILFLGITNKQLLVTLYAI